MCVCVWTNLEFDFWLWRCVWPCLCVMLVTILPSRAVSRFRPYKLELDLGEIGSDVNQTLTLLLPETPQGLKDLP